MKEWHVRHKVFHQMFKNIDLGDDLSKETIIKEKEDRDIIKRAVEYFSRQSKNLYYPGKSYAVGIIYAKLLEKNFDENFYESLNDKLLLYENDPYFIPYSEAKDIYDEILKKIDWEYFNFPEKASPNFNKTCEYFYKEFLLHDDTKMFTPVDKN